MDRRMLLQLISSGLICSDAFGSTAPNGPYNRSPRDGLMLWSKLNADLSGKTMFSFTAGTVWGFKPQADDITLADFAKRAYGYQNLTARKAQVTSESNVVVKQRSFTFYLDPDAYTPTTEVKNGYTGRIDKAVYPNQPARVVTYTPEGPTSLIGKYPLPSGQGDRPYDLRVRTLGAHAFIDDANFQRFQSSDITWYKLEGNLWSYACSVADLENSTLTHIPSTWSQNLIAEWQTWTGMHGIPGHILFKGNGAHISVDQIPHEFRAMLDRQHPGALDEIQRWGTRE